MIADAVHIGEQRFPLKAMAHKKHVTKKKAAAKRAAKKAASKKAMKKRSVTPSTPFAPLAKRPGPKKS